MAWIDDDFKFVAASVERSARVQRGAARTFLEDTESRGRALARHLDAAYGAVEARVADRRAQYAAAPDDTVRLDSSREMRRLLGFVRQLQSNLAWLDAAQSPQLDLGTTYFVEDAARALVASDAEVTVVATEDSYATTSDPWSPLISAWGANVSDAATVVVVFVPRREQRSGLLHPLIMHELAHAADSEHGMVASLWGAAQRRKRFARRYVATVQALASGSSISVAAANEFVSKRLRAWIAEALCDSVALHHLGPTYLYSFLAEVVAGSLDEAGPVHPPPRQRVRLLMWQLDDLGWAPVLQAGDADVEQWIREMIAEQPTYTAVDAFLTWAIDELKHVVRASSRRLLKARVFRSHPPELLEAETLLGNGIPAAQRKDGSAMRRESVMVAAWHVALRGAGCGPRALAVAPDAPELAELLPAALELSAINDAWHHA